MKKKGQLIIIILFCILCLVPLVLYPVKGREGAESGQISTVLPSLVTKDGFNRRFFEQAGDYFTGNFAFRNELVTADSALRSGLFHTSTKDNVIVGRDGFLFYNSSLDDYLGKATLSDRQLSDIAYNLELMQRTLAEDGIRFVFTVAPNKNSLYPQYMPQKFRTDVQSKNSTRLLPYLEKAGVNYVDLFAFFKSQDEVLYHKTDSHWNNKGAAMANQLLLSAVGKESTDYSQIDYEVRTDFTGDLFRMLYPSKKGTEEEIYYSKKPDYRYLQEIDSTYDARIQTENDKKDGSVLMFRDSFGNSLLPFTADEYGAGFFSRAVPYQVYRAYDRKADTVIAEIVERNLSDLAQAAPVLPPHDCSDILLPQSIDESYQASAEVDEMQIAKEDDDPASQAHTYLKVSGEMDPARTVEGTKTYVSMYDPAQGFGYIFQAYHTSEQKVNEEEDRSKNAADSEDACRYAVYVDAEAIADGDYEVSLLTEENGEQIRSKMLTTYHLG